MSEIVLMASIPANPIRTMTNGSFRLTLEIDNNLSNIMPEIMSLIGHNVRALIVDVDRVQELQGQKNARTKLIQKIHALMGEKAKKMGVETEEYKRAFKLRKSIDISFSDLDWDSLSEICKELEEC